MPAFLHPPIVIVQQAPADTGAGVARLHVDVRGRPMIPVAIDGAGPFDFILDTGAMTSVLRAETAQSQRLATTGETIEVLGVAAREAASTYRVSRFASDLFDTGDVVLPGLSAIGTTQARGIVGMDLFATRRLVFDRALQEVRATASGPAPAGYATVAGIVERGLLYVPMTLNGVAVEALVDSGAEGTVIPPAVLTAMGWKADDPRLARFGQVGGAAGGGTTTAATTIDAVTLGAVTLRNVSVLVGGSKASQAGGAGKPRIILGLNILNRLQAYAIDSPRGELQILPFAVGQP